MRLATGFGACFLLLASFVPLAIAEGPQETVPVLLERAQAHLVQAQADDIFVRAEHLDAALVDLDKLLALSALHPEGLLWRTQTLIQQAEVTRELGAGAVDYWSFVNEKVAPLYARAWADANRLIALQTPLTAQAYYWRAHAHEEINEADLQQACALNYQPACEESHP
ncbi:MAG: hypothetical protein ACO1RX_19730 [Candidatus Sericytochromatia bacterium]